MKRRDATSHLTSWLKIITSYSYNRIPPFTILNVQGKSSVPYDVKRLNAWSRRVWRVGIGGPSEEPLLPPYRASGNFFSTANSTRSAMRPQSAALTVETVKEKATKCINIYANRVSQPENLISFHDKVDCHFSWLCVALQGVASWNEIFVTFTRRSCAKDARRPYPRTDVLARFSYRCVPETTLNFARCALRRDEERKILFDV